VNAPMAALYKTTPEALLGRDVSLDGTRVLLAEDNPVNTLVATRMLRKIGCVVTHAADGRQALAEFQRGSFDVVLLDVQMPEMDGLECSRAIRASEANGAHVPIIALTASAMLGDDARCFAAGMDGYMTKPINRDELFDVLVRARRTRAAA